MARVTDLLVDDLGEGPDKDGVTDGLVVADLLLTNMNKGPLFYNGSNGLLSDILKDKTKGWC